MPFFKLCFGSGLARFPDFSGIGAPEKELCSGGLVIGLFPSEQFLKAQTEVAFVNRPVLRVALQWALRCTGQVANRGLPVYTRRRVHFSQRFLEVFVILWNPEQLSQLIKRVGPFHIFKLEVIIELFKPITHFIYSKPAKLRPATFFFVASKGQCPNEKRARVFWAALAAPSFSSGTDKLLRLALPTPNTPYLCEPTVFVGSATPRTQKKNFAESEAEDALGEESQAKPVQ